MTHDEFWKLIAATKKAAGHSMDAQAEALSTALAKLKPAEIIEFERIFGELKDRAYSWDLWGAAYIIGGGCSDDAFMDFRNWLISMGREVYEQALSNPESLAQLELGEDAEEDAFFEEFGYLAGQVYEEKTGKNLPYPERRAPAEPTGEPWEEVGDDLAKRYPLLWAKYGDVYARWQPTGLKVQQQGHEDD